MHNQSKKAAEHYHLTNDDKYKSCMHHIAAEIQNIRILYTYGLLFHTFATKVKDETLLRTYTQKALRVVRTDFKLQDSLLLPCVLEAVSQALKCKFVGWTAFGRPGNFD